MPSLACLVARVALSLALSLAAFAQTPLRLDLVATGLSRPVLVTAPPGDTQRLFVVEQTGAIRVIQNGQLLAQPFLNLVGTGTLSYGGEMGLLGLAFHPDYAQNGRFFVFHNTPPYPTTTVRSFTVSAQDPNVADPASATTLLRATMLYGNHNGGMIAFGPDGMLYVGIGDGGSFPPSWPDDPQNHAQRGDSLLGKMLRIDVDNPAPPLAYGIPADNPFVGAGDPLDEIWAMGLRNPWRWSFDRLTGDLWIADVGGRREEVDFVPHGTAPGLNFGWSCMQGTLCVNSTCACGSPALWMPLHEYLFSGNRSIIGGFVYRGAAIPDLQGSYFFADYNKKRLWTLRQQNGSLAELRERTFELQPTAPLAFTGITAFGEDAAGELYVCDISGQVYRIVPDAAATAGLAPFGLGTPGCNGPHLLAGSSSPAQGNAAFGVQAQNGAPFGFGILSLASHAEPYGDDPFSIGLVLHFQPSAPLVSLQPLLCDAQGACGLTLPIPTGPSLVGQSLVAQMGFAWPAPCAAAPSGWSSSNGLWLTVQP